MTTFWILVANSSFAKIYEVTGMGNKINLLEYVDFINGRKRDQDINSDKPGRAFDSVGMGRHAVGTAVDAHTHEMQVFTHQLVTLLNNGKLEKKYDQLGLIAPSHLIGELRRHLHEQVRKCVFREVSKDLPESLTEPETQDQMCKMMDFWNHKHK